MRQVKREWLDGYNDAVRGVSEQSADTLRGLLRGIDLSRPPNEVREAVIAAMDVACGSAADMSAAVSADFYEGLRERVLGRGMRTYAQSQRDPKATERAVRSFLQRLFEEDDYDAFEQLCVDRLDYEVKRAAAHSIGYNVGRDPYDGEVRWARVPTGDKTCDFCIMLASRGPVYLTEESAGAFDKYHAHCDCKIIPFWGTERAASRKGGVRRRGTTMEIEGYDPDALYREYLDGKFGPGGGSAGRGSGSTSTGTMRTWHEARERGIVTMGSVGEVQRYIRDSTSYEDLFDRIRLVEKELPYYHLTDKYVEDIRRECFAARKRLIGR